ncbi:exodeoxyribonuclease V subunit alpha [Rhodoferax sp.]|uniref:exodeoxyribonuclease V subunit alpha n=1 Tax=Rhodoferax sp. TaxID=50421 RepID=UPI00261202BA|nr:exodeoxyribonuclease V subunit alpha [Rhodoferax sp.]MDD5479167.1 exodeoxyribonuclease V subunit alpha [Rhodoferax sp.]
MTLLALLEPIEPAASGLPLTALDMAFAQFLHQAQPSADPRHVLLAALTSHQYGRGHACLDVSLLAERGVAVLGWASSLQAFLPEDLAAGAASLPWIHGTASPLVLAAGRLYLRRNWQAEQTIRAAILARLTQPMAVPGGLAESLNSLFDASTATQPDWQKVACALAAHGRFTLITGGPGTGKTTTVVRLLGLLQSQAVAAGKPLRIALAAPTGKAAARLGESIAQAVQHLPPQMQAHIPAQAQTLHKLLHQRSSTQTGAPPALAFDLVVVDEASMIDLALMARLLVAVPPQASLILLGDKDQLASVEAGAVLGQLCAGAEQGAYLPETVQWVSTHSGQDLSAWAGQGSRLAQHTVMLRQSRRFAAESLIGQWARAVNTGQRAELERLWQATPVACQPAATVDEFQADLHLQPIPAVTRLQPASARAADVAGLAQRGWQQWLTQLKALGTGGQAAKQAKQANCSDVQALALLAAFAQFQVLCALREGAWGVTAMNRTLSHALGFAPEGWFAGRPVMVTRNDYHLNLMNGDVGLCLPRAKGLRVAFALGDTVRWVLPSRLDAVETVFAMTVHKSQGSEFEHVALVLPDVASPVLTRELLYTGITRAKQRLTLVVPQAGVLRQAAQTQILRSGGLFFESLAI